MSYMPKSLMPLHLASLRRHIDSCVVVGGGGGYSSHYETGVVVSCLTMRLALPSLHSHSTPRAANCRRTSCPCAPPPWHCRCRRTLAADLSASTNWLRGTISPPGMAGEQPGGSMIVPFDVSIVARTLSAGRLFAGPMFCVSQLVRVSRQSVGQRWQLYTQPLFSSRAACRSQASAIHSTSDIPRALAVARHRSHRSSLIRSDRMGVLPVVTGRPGFFLIFFPIAKV